MTAAAAKDTPTSRTTIANAPAPSVAAQARHQVHAESHTRGWNARWHSGSHSTLSLKADEQQLLLPSPSLARVCIHGRLAALSLI
jgi:hypothetical protein